MSVKTCKQHANEPIFIYAQCAACEIQRYRDEVKQLKAENERLERNRDMWKGQVELQAEELTSLRKDAKRYRWLRRAGNTKAIALVAEHCLDALDEAIDAALGHGEQS